MKIIRVRHEEHFTVIRNRTLRDSRLSFKATGLLAYLLSLPDGTTMSRQELAKVKRDGQDAVMTALRELRNAGYIEHEKVQDEYGIWRTETTVRECPKSPATGPTVAGKSSNGYGESVAGKSRSKGRSTNVRNGARAAVPVARLCGLCSEPASLSTLHGTWLCDAHFRAQRRADA